MKQTVKDFLDGTSENTIITIAYDNFNNVFEGEYKDLPQKYNDEIVLSWDVVEHADGTIEVGIII